MTTTMGEPVGMRNVRLSRLPRMAPLALAAMLLASECQADWRVVPSVTLTGRYTDNFWLESGASKQSQFVTELAPSLAIHGQGPRLVLDGRARWRHFNYRDEGLRRTLDHSFDYAVSGRGTVVREMLFVDASLSRSPQNISAFGPLVEDAPYLAENRTNIQTWRVSPYLQHRFGQTASLMVRYTRDRVSGGARAGFANSNGDSITANLASGSAFGKLGWGLSYMRQDLEDRFGGERRSEMTTGNLRYALTNRFALTASVGYDSYDFDGLGGDSRGRNWSAGFDWTPSQRTQLNASIGRHFYGQTGALSLLHRSRRTVWNVSYDDGITTSRQQFLLPAAIDTAAMLDRLFSGTIKDPLLRQQAVEAYIRDNGLPASLTDNINFLSNRYFRQKTLLGSVAYRMPRSNAVLSVYKNERIALSSQQTDSDLLGSQFSRLNDNVRQHGVNASLDYRLNSRTTAVASAGWSKSRSISTELDNNRRNLRVGLARQLGRDVRATLDLRRKTGTRGFFSANTAPYEENSISASLSAQF
ncbi:TIGR03016 family PEP-CTERM system-associated outer membrane protein [Massilia sp. MS-15]|uniref:TIGR03016 family PEP-CTERM system-associated outer membrane protein n=1 Tax=Massilia sp. MS-15 TaxID=2878200 RepID=UPI001CD463A7|nr:TIGR03016 family PEP-CTERM system-associated outer membrane protein [Massilia sp. MS-15]MCA1245502.1 TIGR03016 family PEP-CTERM system-associated outer membrane protein [Massilia sp. MS-15]